MLIQVASFRPRHPRNHQPHQRDAYPDHLGQRDVPEVTTVKAWRQLRLFADKYLRESPRPLPRCDPRLGVTHDPYVQAVVAAVQQAARESDQLREITIAGQGLHHAATAADRLAIDPDFQVGAGALHVDGGQRPATVVKAHTVPALLRQGRWGIRPVMRQRYRFARLGIGRCERWAEQGTRLLQHLHGRAVLRIHRRHAEEQQGQDQPIRHGGRRIRESRTATHPRVQGVHRPARAPYSATEPGNPNPK